MPTFLPACMVAATQHGRTAGLAWAGGAACPGPRPRGMEAGLEAPQGAGSPTAAHAPLCPQEMVDWFNALRAARFHYLQVAFPGASDADVSAHCRPGPWGRVGGDPGPPGLPEAPEATTVGQPDSGASGLGAGFVEGGRGGGALSLRPTPAGAEADQELPEGRLHGEDRAQGTSSRPHSPRAQPAVGVGHLGPGGAGVAVCASGTPRRGHSWPLSAPSGSPWRGWPGPNHGLRAGFLLSQDLPRGLGPARPSAPGAVSCSAQARPQGDSEPRAQVAPQPGARSLRRGLGAAGRCRAEGSMAPSSWPREGRCAPCPPGGPRSVGWGGLGPTGRCPALSHSRRKASGSAGSPWTTGGSCTSKTRW